MAERIRRGKLSPVELVDAHLKWIAQINPGLNAFVHVDEEKVRAVSQAAEAAIVRGEALGRLHGVPVSVKGSINVAGLRCEAGTRLRTGHVAELDAPLVTRLKRAGAIILGVTNTPEL